MASFTTRVELHNALGKDYEVLHPAMEGQGFSRKIRSADGISFHLPTAEYVIDGTLTSRAVLDRAKIAAKKTGKTYSILVTESAGRRWYGLAKV